MSLRYFIGRDIEINSLMNAFESVSDGKGRLAMVSGEVGIGKTAFWNEYVARQKAYSEFELVCTSFSYSSKTSVDVINSQIDGLRAKSAERPVVFVLDNFNCASKDCVDAVFAFVKGLSENPCKVLVILSYAPHIDIDSVADLDSSNSDFVSRLGEFRALNDSAEDFVSEVSIPYLKLADVAMLIYRLFPDNTFRHDFANILHKFTKGHPLFISEVLEYLIQKGNISKSDNVWNMPDNELFDNPLTLPQLEAMRANALSASVSSISDEASALCILKSDDLDFLLSLRDNILEHRIMDKNANAALLAMAKSIKAKLSELGVCAVYQGYADEIISYCNSLGSSDEGAESPLKENIENLTGDELKAKLNDMLLSAQHLKDDYQMRQVVELADNVLKLIDSNPSVDGLYSYRFRALLLKEEATCWQGFYADALGMAKKMLELSTDAGQKSDIHLSYFWIGRSQHYQSMFTDAKANIGKAIELAKELGDNASVCKYCNFMGLVGISSFNLDLAEKYLKRATDILEKFDIDNNKEVFEPLFAEHLLNTGILCRYRYDYENSRKFLDEALEVLNKLGNRQLIAKAYNNIGLIYDEQDDYDNAIDYLTRALKIDIENNDNVSLSNRYNNIGLLKSSYGYLDEALEYFQKSLKIDEFLNNRPKLAISYDNIGDVMLKHGLTNEAREYFIKGLEINKEIGNERGLGLSNVNLGNLYFMTEEFGKAKEYYEKALEIDLKYDEKQSMMSDYHMIGNVYCRLNEFDEAIEYFNKAVDIALETDDLQSQAALLNNFGNIFFTKNDLDRSLKCYNDALNINIKLGNKLAQSLNYNNIAGIYDKLMKYDEAIANYSNAIKIDRELKEYQQLAVHLENQAASYFNSGEFAKARDGYSESAEYYGIIQNYKHQAEAMRNAADSLRCDHHYTAAEKKLEEAVKICTDNGDIYGEGICYVFYASISNDKKHYKKAIEYYRKASEIFKQEGETDGNYLLSLNNIAATYENLGNNEEALLNHFQVLGLYQKQQNLKRVSDKYLDIAAIYQKLKDTASASRYYMSGYQAAIQCGDQPQLAKTLMIVGQFYIDSGNYVGGIQMMLAAPPLIQNNQELAYDLARYCTLIADSQFNNKDYMPAIRSYMEAAAKYSNLGEIERKAYIYNNIGYTYDTMSMFAQAIKYYKEAYNCYKEADNIDGQINNLKNVALMYEHLEDYKNSAAYYRRVLDMLEDLDVPAEKGEISLDIAESCMKGFSDYQESAKFVDKAYSYYKDADNVPEQIHCLEILSLLYYTAKNDAMGDAALKRLEQQTVYTNDDDIKIQILKSVGSVMFHHGNIVGCMEKFQQAFDISVEHDNMKALGENYFELGGVLFSDDTEYDTKVTFRGKTKTLREFALDCFDFAVRIAETEKHEPLLERALESRALLKSTLNMFDEMVTDYDRALKLAEAHDHQRYVLTLLGKGEVILRTFKKYDMAGECFALAKQKSDEYKIADLSALSSAYTALLDSVTDRLDEAKQILNEVKPYSDFILRSIPDLGQFF